MNAMVGNPGELTNQFNPLYIQFYKMGEVRNPSGIFVFLDSILLVGHEPYLSGLVSLLAAGHEGFCVVLKKGGLCKLATESLKLGRCAALEWLLTPKQMALMS